MSMLENKSWICSTYRYFAKIFWTEIIYTLQ